MKAGVLILAKLSVACHHTDVGFKSIEGCQCVDILVNISLDDSREVWTKITAAHTLVFKLGSEEVR
jgi:hypothetical protein